jgi:hypothetical protein
MCGPLGLRFVGALFFAGGRLAGRAGVRRLLVAAVVCTVSGLRRAGAAADAGAPAPPFRLLPLLDGGVTTLGGVSARVEERVPEVGGMGAAFQGG